MAGNEEETEADGISSQSGDSTNHQDEKNKVAEGAVTISQVDLHHGLVRKTVLPTDPPPPILESTHLEPPNSGKISAERQARWLSLLAKRPSTKDSDTMSGWLMDVLAVSDLATPLKAEDDSATVERGTKPYEQEIGASAKNGQDKSSSRDGEVGEAGNANADGVVKKKRPAELLRDELEESGNAAKSESYVSGSFAEWKERKKQRKQTKGGSDTSGVSKEEAV
jgi:hypothetical protein